MTLRIVWFKRDLRVVDHGPLLDAAESADAVLPLYVIEPTLWAQPDMAPRHWQFIHAALQELDAALSRLGQPLVIRQGDAATIFRELAAAYRISAVHAHQETGNAWTYQRDLTVSAVLREAGIPLFETRQHGVVRRQGQRDGWSRQWEGLMAEAIRPAPDALRPAVGIRGIRLPDLPGELTDAPRQRHIQPGGRERGLRVLQGFLEHRGIGYSGGISSPVTAWQSSSRLSPHLAWGTLSLREVVHASRARRQSLRDEAASPERRRWLRSLRNFEERLHWHCHFMQKLESEPRIEFENMHRACDGLRENEFRQDRFDAWCRGETGLPLVDACMRAVNAGGWLNFRMRALVVSFAAYHLWLHWRQPALYLARQFTDYEPGIHYCQFQMQSGTTGINTLRIYNPVKQSRDQDPDGVFIRRWIPELGQVPTRWLHEPWTMPEAVQRDSGCRLGEDYPLQVVEHEQAAREARQRFTPIRRSAAANAEADAIRHKHGSRRRPAPRRTRPRPQPPQLSLFGDDGHEES